MSQLVLRNKRVKEPGIVFTRNAVSQIPTVKFMQRFEVLAMQGQLPIGRGDSMAGHTRPQGRGNSARKPKLPLRGTPNHDALSACL